jgi:hypothetical protein
MQKLSTRNTARGFTVTTPHFAGEVHQFNRKKALSLFSLKINIHRFSCASESLGDHALALAFKRTIDQSRSKKSYVGPNDLKYLLTTTLIFSKALLVFDVNDGSRDHSITLQDFKRSLVHMDVCMPDIAANQVPALLQFVFVVASFAFAFLSTGIRSSLQ